jgi:hypothetical protein
LLSGKGVRRPDSLLRKVATRLLRLLAGRAFF